MRAGKKTRAKQDRREEEKCKEESRSDAGKRGSFVLNNLQNRIQTHHLQELQDAFCGGEKCAAPAAFFHLRKRAHQRPDSGAVHFRHTGKVDGDLLGSFIHQFLYLLAEFLLALTELERTGKVKDGDGTRFANGDDHGIVGDAKLPELLAAGKQIPQLRLTRT